MLSYLHIMYSTIVVSFACVRFSVAFFSEHDTGSKLATVYTRDDASDLVTSQCLHELFPRHLYSYPLELSKSDVPCVVHCVFRKFGIMSSDGNINLKNYYRRVEALHKYDRRVLVSDVGDICSYHISTMNLNSDHCQKAKAFNDCTQLYAVAFTRPIDQIDYI